MSSQAFDFQDLLQLVELMKSTTQFTEFKLRANGIELELRRGTAGEAAAASIVGNGDLPTPISPMMPAPLSAPTAASAAPMRFASTPAAARQEPAAQPAPAAAHVADEGQAVVAAPMVGTVYLAPEPGAKAFVIVGQEVRADTQICIVEVMKLMNAVPAGAAGVVSQILVADGQTVEFGQPLFFITPK